MTGDWVFWLGWIGAFLLYVVMIYITWRALFKDRANGRRRCPRCWHNLSHTPGMTCSECGYTAVRESQFYRTRRRPLVAAAAILTCLVAAVVLNWQVDQRGWIGLVPTKALIWTMPLTIENGGISMDELERRMRADLLSNREWLMVLERCAGGDMWREPVDDQWAQTYGDALDSLARRLAATVDRDVRIERDSGLLDGPEARFERRMNELLLGIPPRVTAQTRADWPTDVPRRVELTLQDWWPRQCEARMRVTPVIDGAQPITVYRARYSPGIPFSLEVPQWTKPRDAPELDVSVERRMSEDASWEPMHEARIPVEMVQRGAASEDETMAAVSGDELDAAMQRVFGQGIVTWPGGPSPVRFRVNIPAASGAAFANTAIGVKVELMRGDELARRLDLWWLGGAPIDRRYSFEIVYENLELLKQLGTDTSAWTMKVTGDEAIAHRAGPAAQFWAGEVDVPVAVVQQGGAAPQRPWWTQEQLEEEAAGEYSGMEE